MDIGWELSRTGDTAGARAAFGQMLAIDQKLADAKPNATYFQQGVAMSHHNIGRLLSAAGDPSGALSKYGQALAIRQKLADANPSVTEFQKDVAWSLHDIGWALSKKGDLSGAQAAYGRALAIRQKLADANPEVRVIRRDLVACRNNLSDLLRRNHHPAEARDDYDRASRSGNRSPGRMTGIRGIRPAPLTAFAVAASPTLTWATSPAPRPTPAAPCRSGTDCQRELGGTGSRPLAAMPPWPPSPAARDRASLPPTRSPTQRRPWPSWPRCSRWANATLTSIGPNRPSTRCAAATTSGN